MDGSVDNSRVAASSLAGEQDAMLNATQASEPAGEVGKALPAAVATAPTVNPEATELTAAATAAYAPTKTGLPDLATATLTVPGKPAAVEQTAAVPSSTTPAEPATAAQPTTAAIAEPDAQRFAAAPATKMPGAVIEARSDDNPQPVATTAAQSVEAGQVAEKKKGFLSAFFSPNQANAAPQSVRAAVASAKPISDATARPLIAKTDTKPLVQLASVAPTERRGATASDAGGNSLPGVRTTALFEITRKSGIDDDSDVDLHEGDESPVRLASAAGMARLAPNGLLKQTDSVDVACLKPALLRVLQSVEKHYGKKALITSGYRDPARNQRARGARNSLHMFCAAADVQVPGVSKWELANYVRSMPGRGGIGTYCHTDSVHIDVGPERDWNWRCRRRK